MGWMPAWKSLTYECSFFEARQLRWYTCTICKGSNDFVGFRAIDRMARDVLDSLGASVIHEFHDAHRSLLDHFTGPATTFSRESDFESGADNKLTIAVSVRGENTPGLCGFLQTNGDRAIGCILR